MITPWCLFSSLISGHFLTGQTGDGDFGSSHLCFKNLKYSWLILTRTFCCKCFTHDKIFRAPLFEPFQIPVLLSCDLWTRLLYFLSFLALTRSLYSKQGSVQLFLYGQYKSHKKKDHVCFCKSTWNLWQVFYCLHVLQLLLKNSLKGFLGHTAAPCNICASEKHR